MLSINILNQFVTVLLISYCCVDNVISDENSELKIIVNKVESENKTGSKNPYEFNNGDILELLCKNTQIITGENVKMKWKLTQFETDLLVTNEVENSQYKMQILLNGNDRHLKATCVLDKNGKQKSVIFTSSDTLEECRYSTENIIDVTKNEGETYKNDFGHPVLLYNCKNSSWLPAIIKENNNIYDPITAFDNESIYSVWSASDQDSQSEIPYVSVSKKQWRLTVVSNDSSDITDNTRTVTILAVLGVAAILVIFSSIYAYKYCNRRRNVENEHVYEEPVYVVYAQVDLENSNKPPPERINNPYATIIGTIVPKINRPPALPKTNEYDN